MARSCGLRIGPSRFELVVLDGSPKKHKIVSYFAGRLAGAGEDFLAEAVAELKEAAKQYNVPRDNLGVAVDTGMAAFRTVKVPFSDRAKIEEVLKFEVESLLPQWNIDEVVVDFHALESATGSSELLVTAIPKQDLQKSITLCEKAGLEPHEIELETTAMVNAALGANICTPETAQILVHVGEKSTSVVVMDGGNVREMRAIHIGALSHEFPVPVAPEEGAEEAPAQSAELAQDPAEIQRRLDQAIKRIRRELGRTVSASRTKQPLDAIYICGFDIPALVDAHILDLPVRVLDVFEKDGGQPAEGYGQLVVAYGVALRQLGGGVLRPSLRREELRFTGAFERIELPLAVVCLLSITLLAVWNIFLFKERSFVDSKLHYWLASARSYLIGNPKQGMKGTLEYPSEVVLQYVNNLDKDDRNRFEQMRHLQGLLNGEIKKLEKDLGQDAEITQPQSALKGLLLVLDVMEKAGPDVGRPSLRKVGSTYQLGRSGRPDSVRINFDVAFFAADSLTATQHYENFVRALESQPWFLSFEKKPSDPLENGEGIYLSGIAVTVDVTKAPQPEPAGGKS